MGNLIMASGCFALCRAHAARGRTLLRWHHNGEKNQNGNTKLKVPLGKKKLKNTDGSSAEVIHASLSKANCSSSLDKKEGKKTWSSYRGDCQQ